MDSTRQPLIEIASVSKHFGGGETRVDALRDIDLTVRQGEVVALLGPSGSGKTTLLNIIGCILAPTEGKVTLDGELVFDGRWLRADLRRLRLDKIGFKVGLCFHVGSQVEEAESYELALKSADWVRNRAGVPLVGLDVGGGFPAVYGHDPNRKAKPMPPLALA